VSYFKTLPTNFAKQWAIYLLVLEKAGSIPKIYIGSGTDAKSGVSARLRDYDKGRNLPRWVQQALKDGYRIMSKGLLCETAIPSAGHAPLLRALFIVLEASLTFALWTVKTQTESGFGLTSLCRWGRHTLEYEGLCSHNPLKETVGRDFNLSAEELEAPGAVASERNRKYNTTYMQNARAANPEKTRKLSKEQYDRNPQARAQATRKSRDKAKTSGKYLCALWNVNGSTKCQYDRHPATLKHQENATKALSSLGALPSHQPLFLESFCYFLEISLIKLNK